MESRQHALETAHALKEIGERLNVGIIYKTSFDKANRTSASAARGIGLKDAMPGIEISSLAPAEMLQGRGW